METGHISETVRDAAKVAIKHQLKVAYALSEKKQITDLE